MAIGTSEKLAQERLRGNCDRFAVGKRVGSCVWKVSHDLESVRGAGGLLHRSKRWRDLSVRCFRLCEKPRRAVLRDQKINFCLRLVPYVVEGVVAESEIVPHVNGLEQMAGNEVFEPRTFIRHFAPVALIPLRRFTNRVLNVPEPRADSEPLVEIFQRGNPCLDRRLGDTDLAGEGGCHDLVSGAGEQQFRKHPDSRDIGNLRKITKVFAEKLLAAKLAPTVGESRIAADERLGKPAMRPKRAPVIPRYGTRLMGFSHFKFGSDEFGDTERVHVIEKVTPHEAIATALVDVEPCASSDDKAHAVFVEVEEPLEKRLPAYELMNLVKRDDGFLFGCDSKSGGVGEAGGITCDEATCGEIVPSEIPIRKHLGKRRLSALARSSEKYHLPVFAQMLFNYGFVYAFSPDGLFHGGNYIKLEFPFQYQNSGNAGMVKTKPVQTLEWYRSLTTREKIAPSFFCRERNKGKRM